MDNILIRKKASEASHASEAKRSEPEAKELHIRQAMELHTRQAKNPHTRQAKKMHTRHAKINT